MKLLSRIEHDPRLDKATSAGQRAARLIRPGEGPRRVAPGSARALPAPDAGPGSGGRPAVGEHRGHGRRPQVSTPAGRRRPGGRGRRGRLVRAVRAADARRRGARGLLYFAGLTSLFFTLSILWQQGLGRGALQTGLLVLPFAVASLSTASNSYKFSTRFGRKTVHWATA